MWHDGQVVDFWKRFRAGEPAALHTIYLHYVGRVTRTAEAVLYGCSGRKRGADELAGELADVVQEVFVKAFAPEARRRFDPARPYGPYLTRIARNVAIDYWRQMRRYVPSELDQLIALLPLQADFADRARDDWPEQETIALVDCYVDSLDQQSRRVHDALYVKGLSQREAALVLRLGRQVVRTTEAKLRQGLRRELSRAERLPRS